MRRGRLRVAAIGVRVSRSNWIGYSSMHNTGYRVSYGRAYTSSTSSMLAANSASASGGMTQYSIFRFVSPFF